MVPEAVATTGYDGGESDRGLRHFLQVSLSGTPDKNHGEHLVKGRPEDIRQADLGRGQLGSWPEQAERVPEGPP